MALESAGRNAGSPAAILIAPLSNTGLRIARLRLRSRFQARKNREPDNRIDNSNPSSNDLGADFERWARKLNQLK
jgi:hypothetical protein